MSKTEMTNQESASAREVDGVKGNTQMSTREETKLSTRERRMEWLAQFIPADQVQALGSAYEQYFGVLSDPNMSAPERAMVTAVSLVKIKQALGGKILQNVIMPLMNSPIGFDTDKNPAKGYNGQLYPPAVVLDCAAEAFLRGLPLTGNAWNIIAGNCYARKEGFEILLGTVCKFTARAEVPEIGQDLYNNGGYVTVPVSVQYKLLGAPEEEDNQRFHGMYSCRLNKRNAVAVENLEGKAKRKAYRDLWAHLTGSLLADADELGEASVHQVGAHFGDQASADVVASGIGKDAPPDEDGGTEDGANQGETSSSQGSGSNLFDS